MKDFITLSRFVAVVKCGTGAGWLPWSLKKSDVRAVVSAEEVFTESIMEFQGGKERDPSSHMSGLTGAVLHIYLTKGFLKICLGL